MPQRHLGGADHAAVPGHTPATQGTWPEWQAEIERETNVTTLHAYAITCDVVHTKALCSHRRLFDAFLSLTFDHARCLHGGAHPCLFATGEQEEGADADTRGQQAGSEARIRDEPCSGRGDQENPLCADWPSRARGTGAYSSACCPRRRTRQGQESVQGQHETVRFCFGHKPFSVSCSDQCYTMNAPMSPSFPRSSRTGLVSEPEGGETEAGPGKVGPYGVMRAPVPGFACDRRDSHRIGILFPSSMDYSPPFVDLSDELDGQAYAAQQIDGDRVQTTYCLSVVCCACVSKGTKDGAIHSRY